MEIPFGAMSVLMVVFCSPVGHFEYLRSSGKLVITILTFVYELPVVFGPQFVAVSGLQTLPAVQKNNFLPK